jgi:hypothetical protein
VSSNILHPIAVKAYHAAMSKTSMLFCLLLASVRCVAQQQKESPKFPTSEEIQLVVTQSERVFQQYKQSVTMEGELPTAKRDPSSVEKDREVYDTATKLIAVLKEKPQSFHGLGGLLLLTYLDDASRNAALCSGTSYDDSYQALIAKSDINSAKDWLQIGLSCVNISGYMYTVSESVQALLVRDMKAQEAQNERALETIKQCVATMKKCDSLTK